MPVMVDSEGKYVSFTPTVPVAAGAITARVPKPLNTGIAAGTRLR